MRNYSVFQFPLLSFYSSDLYRDMAFNKKGIGFGYLFLLLALCWLLLVISVDKKFSTYIDEYSPGILSQFPEITINDGQASIVESQPYYISDPETGRHIAVIDTTGTINSLDETEAIFLLTRNNFIFDRNKVETRSLDLSELDNMVLDRSILSSWFETVKSYFAAFMYPFLLVGSFLYRIIQMFIYAAIGMLFVAICKAELDYTQLLRLSVLAVTPSIIIKTILWLSEVRLPFSGLMFFILTMGYLYLGIKATTELQEGNISN
jgi:Protein of unknown function (DUF1189)